MNKLFGDAKTESRQCNNHGEYTATNMFGNHWSECPECNRLQCERNAEAHQRELQRQLEDRKSDILKRNMAKSGIPERFQNRTLETYIATTKEQQYALSFAKDFAASFAGEKTGQGAIFCGERGTGKTHIAIGVSSAIMRQYSRSAIFITVQRLIRSVRDTWSRESEKTESEVIRFFTEPDLLVLDEVGVQSGSENEKQILFDLLNERYQQRKSTIVLTNLTANECVAFLGERIVDRFREDGGVVIPFTWDSYRGKVEPESVPFAPLVLDIDGYRVI